MKTQWSFCIGLSDTLNPLINIEDKLDILYLRRVTMVYQMMGRYMVESQVYPTKSKHRMQIQCRLRDHLEFRSYHESKNITPTNYVANVMAQVQHLPLPLEETD